MKKMAIPALLVAVMMSFSLAGCSGASQAMDEGTLKGAWSLDSASELGFDAYLSFEDESVAEMLLGDSWYEGTWEVSGTSGTLTMPDDRAVKMSYDGSKLTLGSSDGSRLVFVKDDSEEVAALFSADSELELEDGEEVEYVDEQIEQIEPVAVADDDKFSITVTGKGTDFTGDPCYMLTITNKTDQDAYIVPDDEFTVGGKQVEAGFGDEIAAGETLETSIYFGKDDVGGGAETLTGVSGVLVAYSDADDAELARYEVSLP